MQKNWTFGWYMMHKIIADKFVVIVIWKVPILNNKNENNSQNNLNKVLSDNFINYASFELTIAQFNDFIRIEHELSWRVLHFTQT